MELDVRSGCSSSGPSSLIGIVEQQRALLFPTMSTALPISPTSYFGPLSCHTGDGDDIERP
jgi:hypothetical protein